MDNHYHLLIETKLPNISKIMQRLNSSYTTYFNIKRRRVRHLFGGRPKIIVVEKDEYALRLSRYIHLNPVKAGIVSKPEDYNWSSYNYFIRRVKTPESSDKINEVVVEKLDAKDRLTDRIRIYLLRKYSDKTLKEIGIEYGKLGVSGVSHVVRRLDKQRAIDKRLDKKIKCSIHTSVSISLSLPLALLSSLLLRL